MSDASRSLPAGVPRPDAADGVPAAGAEGVAQGDSRGADPWHALRALTAARIALGRSGASLPTAAELELRLARARARDAVCRALDVDAVAAAFARIPLRPVRAHSAARDRGEYLRRPDLGRRLDEGSREALAELARAGAAADVVFVVADGLSAPAVEHHAAPLLALLAPPLLASGWTLAPVVLVEQGRVAVGDDVGETLGAGMSVVLIGERPGLSAPHSLGVYLTHAPRRGRTDAERNCVSNIRPDGLDYPAAARVVEQLMREARRRGRSGIALTGGRGA